MAVGWSTLMEIGEAHHQPAASSPRFLFDLRHEHSAESTAPERFVDPYDVYLASSAPDAARRAGDDSVVVAYEDGELLLVADVGGRDRGLGHALLQEGQVEGIRFALDGHAVRAVHRSAPGVRGLPSARCR